MSKAMTKVQAGAAKNKIQFAFNGMITSFNNNFKPSANACNNPQKPTTFGPLRL